jgi:hypothetical protein
MCSFALGLGHCAEPSWRANMLRDKALRKRNALGHAYKPTYGVTFVRVCAFLAT